MSEMLNQIGAQLSNFLHDILDFVIVWWLSHIRISCDSMVDLEAPLSMGFPRQEYQSELPFPSSRNLPNPGIKPVTFALAGRFFTTEPPGKPPPQTLLLFSHPVVSDSLPPHGLQHTGPPCPSSSPRVCPSSCPLHQ